MIEDFIVLPKKSPDCTEFFEILTLSIFLSSNSQFIWFFKNLKLSLAVLLFMINHDENLREDWTCHTSQGHEYQLKPQRKALRFRRSHTQSDQFSLIIEIKRKEITAVRPSVNLKIRIPLCLRSYNWASVQGPLNLTWWVQNGEAKNVISNDPTYLI